MRIVVAGCRIYDNYDEAKSYISSCLSELKIDSEITFLSGCCKGADALGERYAKEYGYEIIKYPPQWDKYGKAAGIKRNIEMARNCDFIICFWDGRSKGTGSLIKQAEKWNKPLRIKII